MRSDDIVEITFPRPNECAAVGDAEVAAHPTGMPRRAREERFAGEVGYGACRSDRPDPTVGEEAGVHDELRHLDEELAAGRLDADTYRRRRDALLATRLPEPAPPATPDRAPVSGPGAPADLPAELPGALPDEVPGEGPAAAPRAADAPRDPFPPPFRWSVDADDPRDDPPPPDSTQVVAASLAAAADTTGTPPDRTQVVANGAGAPAEPTQVVGRSRVRDVDPRAAQARARPPTRPAPPPAPPPPPERTQFVPATALARAGERRSVPARETLPPWVDDRSPHPADIHRQGPELFTRGTGPSAATVAGTAAVVLVVAAVLVLSFLLS